MVGFTCAACHVTDIHYKDQRIRLDGAPNTINVYPFYSDLLAAAEKGFEDAEKVFELFKQADHLRTSTRHLLDRIPGFRALENSSPLAAGVSATLDLIRKLETAELNQRYKDGGRNALANSIFSSLEKNTEKIQNYVRSLDKHQPAKGGPLDLESPEETLHQLFHDYTVHVRLYWGHIEWLRKYVASNQVEGGTPLGHGSVDAFGTARNLVFLEVDKYLPCVAPVSIPHLWGLKETRWLHWNANTNSVMQRNIIQALGTGAVLDPATLETTLILENINRLDELAEKITSPPWPQSMFGSIDQAKAKRGQVLYAEYCASCHNAAKKVDDLFEYPLFALSDGNTPEDEVVGTDPGQAVEFDRKVNDTLFPEALKQTSLKIEAAYYARNGISIEQQKEWRGEYRQDVAWRSPLSNSNTKPPLNPSIRKTPHRSMGHRALPPQRFRSQYILAPETASRQTKKVPSRHPRI
jgi:hypothetical protein